MYTTPCLKGAELIDERFKQKRIVAMKYWIAHSQLEFWGPPLGKWNRDRPWN